MKLIAPIFQLKNGVEILFIVIKPKLKIVVFDVTFCFSDNFDLTGL